MQEHCPQTLELTLGQTLDQSLPSGQLEGMQVVEPLLQPLTDPHLHHHKGACLPPAPCPQQEASRHLLGPTLPLVTNGYPQWGACLPQTILQGFLGLRAMPCMPRWHSGPSSFPLKSIP